MSYHKVTPHYTDPESAENASYPTIIDTVTGAAVNIDFPHHEIHEGDHYAYQEVVDLSLNNVFDLRITTPNTTKMAHLDVQFVCEAETNAYLYENVIKTTTGTLVAGLNRNRNSTNTPAVILTTITSGATSIAEAGTSTTSAIVLAHGYFGSGVRFGGEGDTRLERVLKQNYTYGVRFIAVSAGYISFLFDWYEHAKQY